MARAALSVVYAHERDEEVAALRARVARLERSIEDICWFDRMRHCQHECEDCNNYDYIFDKVSELLVWPIEQQCWGVRKSVFSAYQEEAPGLLNFHSAYDVEHTLLVMLAYAMQDAELRPIEYYMREVEYDLVLPRGSLARLPADSELR